MVTGLHSVFQACSDFIVGPLLPEEFPVVHWIALDVQQRGKWKIRHEHQSMGCGARHHVLISTEHFGERLRLTTATCVVGR